MFLTIFYTQTKKCKPNCFVEFEGTVASASASAPALAPAPAPAPAPRVEDPKLPEIVSLKPTGRRSELFGPSKQSQLEWNVLNKTKINRFFLANTVLKCT